MTDNRVLTEGVRLVGDLEGLGIDRERCRSAGGHLDRKALGLPAWFDRELRSQRPQAWADDQGLAEPDVEYLFHGAAWLFGALAGRHQPLPHYRTMEWAAFMDWLGEALPQFHASEAARQWEQRDVVHRLENGWTIERVTTRADFEREGVLMKNCLLDEKFEPPVEILSLRDPVGQPHADLSVVRGRLVELQGRCVRWPKPAYVEMVVEFLGATGLELSPYAEGLFAGAESHTCAA